MKNFSIYKYKRKTAIEMQNCCPCLSCILTKIIKHAHYEYIKLKMVKNK